MARVARPSRSGAYRSTTGAHTPNKQQINIPLNDDVEERGKRLNSRKALHERQYNEIKAAATPRKGSVRLEDAENDGPGSGATTPRGGRVTDFGGEEPVGLGGGLTPVKRVPILANFEEWMKMATDNKINATNSWNFALIDYFHDMSLLKEGDGVNFQKASCTLDGCVKIYTNRVDSVATETGKLLSGLADSNSNKKKNREGEEGDGDESEEELDEDGNPKKKPKKKSQRSSEATLAPSFNSLQLKKFELEFAVDPLFKKASADFDEGGAKGLLLNHLMVDSQGRIVFDSSDDAGDDMEGKKQDEEQEDIPEEEEGIPGATNEDTIALDVIHMPTEGMLDDNELDPDDVEIDLGGLRRTFFPDLSRLDELDVCPSLKTFTLGDPSGSMDIPFLRAPEDVKQDHDAIAGTGALGDMSGVLIEGDAPVGFDDDDLGLGSFDLGDDVAFGEGGEAWARDAALEPQMRGFGGAGEDEAEGDQFDDKGEYIVSMDKSQNKDQMHEDILGFFDQALQKNWSSAEHWRIRKIKDASKSTTETKKRKEKEPFEIDFTTPLEEKRADMIFTQASSNSAISLPKKDWVSKSKNLLPDDKHFSSKSLLSLFLKPKARLSRKRIGFGGRPGFENGHDEVGDMPMDEAFWAKQKAPLDNDDDVLPQGDYDANFFQDDQMPFADGEDDDDDLEFADAREHFSPGMDGHAGMTENVGLTALLSGDTMNPAGGAFGHTLVTNATRRVRPDYVQYARVAKKVDVRRLKEEMWKGMEFDTPKTPPDLSHLPTPEPETEPQTPKEDKSLKFTTVMNGLKTVYPKPAMNDISTSFCFIALLHLANERGLVINKSENLSELEIQRDWTAEVVEGGE